MSYTIDFSVKARDEGVEVVKWIAQYSPEKTLLWHFDLQVAVESLSESPARCSLAPESRTFKTEIRHLLFGKYRILFRIEDETVHILHIRHSSRKTLTPKDEAGTDLPDENADGE